MKNSTFKITIAGTMQAVWETMLSIATYQEWTSAGWPGSFYKGEWAEGQKIHFIGNDGSGTLGLIEKYQPFNFIAITHIAILLAGGIEDTNSDLAKGWIGTKESYTFQQNQHQTELTVEIQTNPDWEKMFNDGWPKALAKLKEICERNN